MRTTSHACVIFWVTWIITFGVPGDYATAQNSSVSGTTDDLTVASIQEQLRKIDNVPHLDDTTKSTIRDLLQQTRQDIDATTKWLATAEQFRRATESATADVADARRQLDSLRPTPLPPLPGDLSIGDLKERLASQEGELAELRAASKSANDEANRRAARRRKISTLLKDLPKQIEEIDSQLASTPPPNEAVELTSARRRAA